MTLEPYQQNAIDWLRVRKRGAVISPAGSGKTLIMAGALEAVIKSKPRNGRIMVGWMANTREQVQQARTALQSFPLLQETITVKIRCAAADTDWSDRAVLIVDEVHHCVAPSWHFQIESCKGAVWGCTATPPEEAEAKKIFEALFGETYVVPRSEVSSRITAARVIMLNATDPHLEDPIDAAIAVQVEEQKRTCSWWLEKQSKVSVMRATLHEASIVTPTDNEILLARQIAEHKLNDRYRDKMDNAIHAIIYRRVAWNVCIALGIVENKARNNKAVEMASKHSNAGDSVLMLVNQIDHGKGLAERIPGAAACWSGMGIKRRREALERFKDGSLHCVVATSLADEGADFPRANILVMVCGGRSKAKAEQRTGRVLRTFAGKTHGLIYDFTDKQHPMMEKHSQARATLYRKLGYQIESTTPTQLIRHRNDDPEVNL